MPKTRAAYPAAFRQQMIELVRAGRSPEALAREFEPTAQHGRDSKRNHELEYRETCLRRLRSSKIAHLNLLRWMVLGTNSADLHLTFRNICFTSTGAHPNEVRALSYLRRSTRRRGLPETRSTPSNWLKTLRRTAFFAQMLSWSVLPRGLGFVLCAK